MSKFPNQLLLVSVSTIVLIGVAVGMSEKAAREAAELAHAAADHATETEAEAEDVAEAPAADTEAQSEEVAEAPAAEEDPVAEDVAEAPAAGETESDVAAEAPVAEEPDEEVAKADTSAHGHGDAGTAPIASIIAGAAVAQSVDSPALDATGIMYGLGREALPEEVAAWDQDIRPDGLGLPEGSGDVWTGDEVFAENCAVCHGDFAEGVDRWPVLAGGQDSLTQDRPIKTIGSFWPYLSTVFDYVQRAMPFGNAHSLTADETYAITAYLLYSNDLVDDDFVLSHENFTEVRLPNEENFFMDDRAEGELPAFTRDVCMENCKESVEIVARAAVIDVTPEGAEGGFDLEGGSAPAAAAVTEASAPAGGEAGEAALVAEGEKIYKHCSTCHEIGAGAENKVGPILTGIVGREAGQVEDFRYSRPMKTAAEDGLVWSSEELHAFLADPRAYMKGTKMSFRGLKKPEEIDALIAYLSSVSAE